MKTGIELIAEERQRQVSAEGFDASHDDAYKQDELVRAAFCYMAYSSRCKEAISDSMWPWHLDWWKPKDKKTDLIRAGALIAAEIDRINRLPPNHLN